jgi:K+-sensing histidine kinase KdpD
LQYFVAIAATAVVFTARFLLKSVLGNVAPLLLFTLSVMLSAWYGGLGPGLLATALSLLLGDYFFIAESVAERIEEALFLGIGVSISVLSHGRLSLLAKRQQLLASEEEARRAAEDARTVAEDARMTAEDARMTAEDARKVAEDANRLKDEFFPPFRTNCGRRSQRLTAGH